MTRDDIIRIAREAGFENHLLTAQRLVILDGFAALVSAAEREACANVCTKWPKHDRDGRAIALSIAHEIRARGETK